MNYDDNSLYSHNLNNLYEILVFSGLVSTAYTPILIDKEILMDILAMFIPVIPLDIYIFTIFIPVMPLDIYIFNMFIQVLPLDIYIFTMFMSYYL